MIEYILTTAKELDNESVGTVIIDSNGHAWQKESQTETIGGVIRSSWFNAISGEYQLSETLEKEGPCTAVYIPKKTTAPCEPSQREYGTEADLEELKNAPFGTIIKDADGSLWVKANYGWAHAGSHNSLYTLYAPYTIIHTPPSDLANL